MLDDALKAFGESPNQCCRAFALVRDVAGKDHFITSNTRSGVRGFQTSWQGDVLGRRPLRRVREHRAFAGLRT